MPIASGPVGWLGQPRRQSQNDEGPAGMEKPKKKPPGELRGLRGLEFGDLQGPVRLPAKSPLGVCSNSAPRGRSRG
jgi:hypothetical protein